MVAVVPPPQCRSPFHAVPDPVGTRIVGGKSGFVFPEPTPSKQTFLLGFCTRVQSEMRPHASVAVALAATTMVSLPSRASSMLTAVGGPRRVASAAAAGWGCPSFSSSPPPGAAFVFFGRTSVAGNDRCRIVPPPLRAASPSNSDSSVNGNGVPPGEIDSLRTRVSNGSDMRDVRGTSHINRGNRTGAAAWGEFGRPPVSSPRRTFATSSGSAAAAAPWVVPKTVDIPEDKVEISFVRSSGAGGQNVNKVSTKVEVRMHVPSSAGLATGGGGGGGWIPGEVRDRLAEQQAHRISGEGMLTVTSQEHRTQGQNKREALDKLRRLILEAWPRPKVRKQRTGVSKAAKERNVQTKRHRSLAKQNRKRVDNDW